MNKSSKERQVFFFTEETGLPLFSKSPMQVRKEAFDAKPTGKQENLFRQPTMENMQAAAWSSMTLMAGRLSFSPKTKKSARAAI